MFDAFRAFEKQNRPFALASRSTSYRSRPPPYPRLWFGLRAYDTNRENAARSPCSFLVLSRRGTAGQLLLVSLSPCRSCSRNHGSRPASTASLSTSKGTSCGPLVCLCYTRVAMHGRSFPSARVIVVVLPLPFCRKRISVGRAHLHRKRMHTIRRFRTNLTFRRNIHLSLYMKSVSAL